ncbi:GTP-binding protein [Clostridium sp. DJ247]|uniref:GTP-binding protein n=1 Tax=Clostridium sp. DJ247 TaxID=2726188 RepID=UPI001628B561|nr:GTP-binding protein [Clostridium sp. DJ247]MBC2582187.1 GTP-binding protein [Clostridium sp. DJ247]
MMIKVDIELVTGFIGSGKTKFINSLIENTFVPKENIIVIQYECGETNIAEKIQCNSSVKIVEVNPNESLNFKSLKYMIELHKPHRVIIEFNGTRKVEDFIASIQNSKIKKNINTVYHLTDAITFETYIKNMGNLLIGGISNSDLIIINNCEKVDNNNLKYIKTKINELNPYAYVLELKRISELSSMLKREDLLSNGFFKKLNVSFKNLIMKR